MSSLQCDQYPAATWYAQHSDISPHRMMAHIQMSNEPHGHLASYLYRGVIIYRIRTLQLNPLFFSSVKFHAHGAWSIKSHVVVVASILCSVTDITSMLIVIFFHILHTGYWVINARERTYTLTSSYSVIEPTAAYYLYACSHGLVTDSMAIIP
jgi:hypothetical protein